MTEAEVEREVTLAADPEEVWESLTDPEELSRWFGGHCYLGFSSSLSSSRSTNLKSLISYS